MTTADALEPAYEQTLRGQAELIMRSWRFQTAPSQNGWDPAAGRRGRENALKQRRRKINA